MAEATLLLMLTALRRLPFLDARTRAGAGWDLDPGLQDGLGEIAGRTVGLVGFGAVPELLAPMLSDKRETNWTYAVVPKEDEPRRQIRVCDEAAETIAMHAKNLEFRMQGEHEDLDRQIEQIRRKIAAAK